MPRSFDLLEIKVAAREECLIRCFQENTGLSCIPPDKQFWSLCNKQTKRSTSEINQLTDAGLIKKSQYHGVDRDIRNIKKNEKNHPQAHWYHGEWDSVLRKNKKIFNPALVFLDSTSLAETDSIIQSTHDTMLLCPPGTFLLVNVMLNNPRNPLVQSFESTTFIGKLTDMMHEGLFKKWEYPSKCFVYNATGYTKMATYPFTRFVK